MAAHTPVRWAALVGCLVIAAAACSSGGDDAADPTAQTFETVAATEPLFTPNSDDGGAPMQTDVQPTDDAADPTAETDVEPTSPPASEPETTPPTVPDTGVPGIDSDDVFCRSWSEFAGSFQALAGAWAFGEPTEAARSEVAASMVIRGATATLLDELPAELEGERASVADLVEPLARRAEAATADLVAAGVSEAGITALAEAWLVALVEVGVDDPTIAIVVPPQVDSAAFGAAATAFAAAKPSIVEDPSLITGVEIPLTEQYLVANCPDQGTLGGNDDVGD